MSASHKAVRPGHKTSKRCLGSLIFSGRIKRTQPPDSGGRGKLGEDMQAILNYLIQVIPIKLLSY